MKLLRERLVDARIEAKLSQTALALRARCAQSTIGGLESGRRFGSGALPRIAEALDVEALWLAEGRGPKRRHQGAATEPPGYRLAHGDDSGEQVTKPARKANVAPIKNGRNADIAEVVAMMESTDDKGRALALGAVKGALANYGIATKKSCEIVDLRVYRMMRLNSAVEVDH